MTDSVLLGKGASEIRLLAHMANRHGLIAGATGTGKTVTLRVMAEGLSRLGVPVFMADVKGDLAGLSQAGAVNEKFVARAAELGVTDYKPQAAPVTFWDALSELGIPVRATTSEMGPLLLARLLDLNDTQRGVLTVVFKAADDQGLLLLDLKDLQAMLTHVAENAKVYSAKYGNVSTTSVAAIQRGLLALAQQGGDRFFGEPALQVEDLMRTDAAGRGVISILAAEKLMESPTVYATFLLWLLAELFETLPEVGDLDKPKLVFFFDEAHLLFAEAPKAVIERVEQVVRLIRSKGVGVYFVTQSPLDVPDNVLGQLGNRVQHALRAFTPKDQKAVRAAAQTFRSDGAFDVEKAITELAVGESLVSMLDENGTPRPVERAKIAPPEGRLGAITPEERKAVLKSSPLAGRYEKAIDRESAYEILKARTASAAESSEKTVPAAKRSTRQSPVEAAITSAARSFGTQIGRQLLRGIFGSLSGGSRRRK
ncbi:MAG TPA: helicase HerA-like domain-containing protein [Pirellulales bacterium]|nr:helicase HerA-like domain-containing protein [Pirellulales bacterium]